MGDRMQLTYCVALSKENRIISMFENHIEPTIFQTIFDDLISEIAK